MSCWGAYWLRGSVSEMLKVGIGGGNIGDFRRFYRGQNYRLILERNKNRAGDFMKVLKIQKGAVKNIIVPGEFRLSGWKSFLECLDNIFNSNRKAAAYDPFPPNKVMCFRARQPETTFQNQE